MGLRIIIGNEEVKDGLPGAVLYCSTMGIVFGPTMNGNHKEEAGPEFDAEAEARLFISWLKEDARRYEVPALMNQYGDFVKWYKALPPDTDIRPLIDDEKMMGAARKGASGSTP